MPNRKKQNQNKKGFSFVELIVVITIIMLLTTVGLVSFSGAGAKSRDSRRIADLEKVRIALELYRQQNGSYPVGNGSNVDNVKNLLTGGAIKYLDKWPDSIKNYGYGYATSSPPYSYTLYAYMEDVGSTRMCSPAPCPLYCLGAPSTNSCNYYVTNP